jgi:cytochrome c biogenesis protein CcmG/thiol:disulfide interchange protein DsbE
MFLAGCLLAAGTAGAAEPLKAPEFTLDDLDGNAASLGTFTAQGPVVISFWATWCKPCLRELPHMQELYDRYRERGLSVLAISVDSPRSISKVKSFVSGHKYTFTVLLDTNKDVAREFNAHLFPYTFVLNRNAEIVYKNYGYRPGDEKKVEEKVLELLDESAEHSLSEQEQAGE